MMIKDYEASLIELTESETMRFKTDQEFKSTILKIAADIADQSDLTCEIYGPGGELLQAVKE